MTAVFAAPQFTNDRAARAFLEEVMWPHGPVCAHCGVINNAFQIKRKGEATGAYRCNDCRKDFSVTMKTVMERSHIALHKWVLGFHLMTSSKKGVSAHQLHRTLGITYRSAWFMAHRIREAMRAGGITAPVPIGGEGKIVEADETYIGKIKEDRAPSPQRKGRPYTKAGKSGPSGKRAVMALVERGGSVRMFHLASPDKATVTRIVRENVAKESRLHTDESRLYFGSQSHFASHETVKHSAKEYVRGDVTTNTVEGVFSIFKRGMKGIYQHCAEKHLHRYLAEYEFRHNHRTALGVNDKERTLAAVKSAKGKRLEYRQPH